MLDDASELAPADPTRVNVNQAHELRYWTNALGVSADRLREVVAQVGTAVVDVRRRVSDSTYAE
jgi:hypothetical protein